MSTSTVRRDLVEVALQARRDGHRVTLDNFHAAPSGSASVAGQNTARAGSENAAGRFSMVVYDAEGKEYVKAGINRDDAKKLVAAGAEFVGHAWRAP